MFLGSLPMYDWPEQHAANDIFWELIAGELGDRGLKTGPSLHRQEPYSDLWLSPKLAMSQTCGLPLVTSLHERAIAFAAPMYDVDGAGRGTYSSAIIVRKGDPATRLEDTRGYTFGFNGQNSQSGVGGLKFNMFSKGISERFFGQSNETGSHRETVKEVAAGRVDIGAIDCLSWDLAKEHEAEAANELKIIGWTHPTPAMPFIINQHSGLEPETMFELVSTVILDQAPFETLQQLRLRSIIPCTNAFFQPTVDELEQMGDYKLTDSTDGP